MTTNTDRPAHTPPHGSTIQFSIPPTGSWAKAGETYRATHDSKVIRLQNVKTGSGTFDDMRFYKSSKFEVVE